MIAATPADLVAPLIGSLISFFDQRVGRHANRDRLALDTIEAMAVMANRKGRITRSRASRQDSNAARCPECSYFPARPMSAKNVRDARRVVELAHLDDAVANGAVDISGSLDNVIEYPLDAIGNRRAGTRLSDAIALGPQQS